MANIDTNTSSSMESMSALLGAYLQYQQNAQFSQANADRAGNQQVAALFRDYKDTALPKVYAAQGTTGAYNSTSGQLLANDAYASTVAKAAEALGKLKLGYGALQNNSKVDLNGQGNNLGIMLQMLNRALKNNNTDATTNSAPTGGFAKDEAGNYINYSDSATSGSAWNGNDDTTAEALSAWWKS